MSLFVFFTLSYCDDIQAQTPISIGSNTNGLADTSVWAVTTNPSRLSRESNLLVGVQATNHFFVSEFSTYSIVASLPVRENVFGVELHNYGYSVWNENQIGLSVSRQLAKQIALGVKLDYVYINHGNETEADVLLMPHIYISYKCTDYTYLFAHFSAGQLVNKTEAYLYDNLLYIGGQYLFSSNFNGVCEIESSELDELLFHVGMEYYPVKKVGFRFGVSSGDEPLASGFSIGMGEWNFDISAQYHSVLGVSTSGGFRFRF